MDEIRIHNLEVYGHHGVLKEENILGQKFLVSISLGLSVRKAGMSDDIEDSIDYAKVSHLVKEEMERTTFKLIEALAEHLCESILIAFPIVESVMLELKKPWAPILLPLDTVSVRMERKRHEAYIALGANLGDRKQNLDDAVHRLREDKKISVIRESELIETKPYGVEDQPDFLNGVIYIKTLYEPEELLQVLHDVENAGGRERKEHWGARTIDLDIIYYDDIVYDSETLTIPHRDMLNRSFVLEPLAEIAPYKRHPLAGITSIEALERLKVSES